MTLRALQGDAARCAVYRGTVFAFDREGWALVRSGAVPAPVRCDVLEDAFGPLRVELGDTVAFAMYAGEPGGCILGRIGSPRSEQPATRRAVRLAAESLEVDADKISLRTPHGRITIDPEGNLEMVAWTLISKARRLQRFLAPILRLN